MKSFKIISFIISLVTRRHSLVARGALCVMGLIIRGSLGVVGLSLPNHLLPRPLFSHLTASTENAWDEVASLKRLLLCFLDLSSRYIFKPVKIILKSMIVPHYLANTCSKQEIPLEPVLRRFLISNFFTLLQLIRCEERKETHF